MILRRIEDALGLVDALAPTVGAVERWSAIGGSDVQHVASGRVGAAVDDGLLVVATTDKDPDVRMHVSREGRFYVTTVSFRTPATEEFMRSLINDLRDQFAFVAVAFGEELEVEANASGGYEFNGDCVMIL